MSISRSPVDLAHERLAAGYTVDSHALASALLIAEGALDELLRYVPESGATIRPGYGNAAERARAALSVLRGSDA